jgi:hypothetical protein
MPFPRIAYPSTLETTPQFLCSDQIMKFVCFSTKYVLTVASYCAGRCPPHSTRGHQDDCSSLLARRGSPVDRLLPPHGLHWPCEASSAPQRHLPPISRPWAYPVPSWMTTSQMRIVPEPWSSMGWPCGQPTGTNRASRCWLSVTEASRNGDGRHGGKAGGGLAEVLLPATMSPTSHRPRPRPCCSWRHPPLRQAAVSELPLLHVSLPNSVFLIRWMHH